MVCCTSCPQHLATFSFLVFHFYFFHCFLFFAFLLSSENLSTTIDICPLTVFSSFLHIHEWKLIIKESVSQWCIACLIGHFLSNEASLKMVVWWLVGCSLPVAMSGWTCVGKFGTSKTWYIYIRPRSGYRKVLIVHLMSSRGRLFKVISLTLD